jgi:release factor glutamine methyltransferase
MFDMIVSNPPYVAEHDRHLMEGDLRFEPRAALIAGTDGLDALRRIVADAAGRLVPGGWLLLEHGYDQAEALHALFIRHGYWNIRNYRDLAGQARISAACR